MASGESVGPCTPQKARATHELDLLAPDTSPVGAASAAYFDPSSFPLSLSSASVPFPHLSSSLSSLSVHSLDCIFFLNFLSLSRIQGGNLKFQAFRLVDFNLAEGVSSSG